MDIALREPAVQTKNGEATLQMKVPDNLTTRVVDVIGITQDAKLGTTTSKLVVSKPLLIEANLPTFLTYGDTLQLPMKVITTQDSSLLAETDITVEGTIKTEDGRSFPLGKMTTKPNSRVVLPISVPDQVWDQTNLILELTASGGDEQDAVRQTIPLRTE
ncbi:MAG: alpha-2-macroglobulin family protein [bacterium]|nr:alpha-2-macroglobulin family protein [bacterium]